MNRNIVLKIAYDGTHYLGWQKANTGPSIESVLKTAIETILNHPVTLQAASRTDAGVHAEGQIVNFFTGQSVPSNKLQIGINALLPPDIRVLEIFEADASFHPTLNCIGKEYHYRIDYGPVQSPHYRFYEWHVPSNLDLEAMQKGAQLLIGTHDFKAFCNVRKNMNYDSYVRTITSIELLGLPNAQLVIKIKGSAFLYKMVRNIVGTLVYIGQAKLDYNNIPAMLKEGDRTKSGITAPSHGLCLKNIFYKTK